MSSMMCGMLLGAGVSAKKTYIDDVFSTTLYRGNDSSNTITTNIDSSSNDSLLWIKNRTNTVQHQLFDTVRGANKVLKSNTNDAEWDGAGVYNQTFTSTGFTLNNTTTNLNSNNNDYTSWTFRKAPGFFDVVTWTGNSDTDQVVSHSLGSLPGMILYKPTSSAGAWWVYHREMTDTPNYAYAVLNTTAAAGTDSNQLHDVTSTTFKAVDLMGLNTNGETYVAYLFAGGESTAATARSVDFDGSGDYLSAGSSSDFTMGTGDFTVEGWVKFDNATADDGVFQISDTSGGLKSSGNAEGTTIALSHNPGGNAWNIFGGGTAVSSSSTFKRTAGQWYHFAYVRHSSTTTLYINGENIKSFSDSYNYDGTYLAIGGYYSTSYLLDGRISNFRIVKGTALYTSSFKPTNEPLSSVTNTKLLCCNNSSVTGTTTGTVTSSGDPTASSDSPFDDPAAFTFGDSGDEGVIKTGSYIGNGNADGPEIFLGWEPQWILHKSSSVSGTAWHVFDCMRGVVTGGNDAILVPNTTAAEASDSIIDVTSTGFKITTSAGGLNQNNGEYIYVALRRSDGYVGKPPELGTDVFAMDAGNSSSTIPTFDSTFPVDMGLFRRPASSEDWTLINRLTGDMRLKTNTNAAEASSGSEYAFDSNTGFMAASWANTNYQAWMWKRHAGFDVVTYKGDAVAGRQIPHSLNKIPEMLWVKRRTSGSGGMSWLVYHKGLDGGTNPQTHYLLLNSTAAEGDEDTIWNDTAPTSTHFTLGGSTNVNRNDSDHIAMLFASVDGISSVGSYSGSSSAVTVTTGFQPRFLIIKSTSSASNYNWYTWDTVRGWGSGNDYHISLNKNQAQSSSGLDMGGPTSTGFTVNSIGGFNSSGQTFVYYAHA